MKLDFARPSSVKQVLPEGVYDFQFVSAAEGFTRTGKEMITVTLRVTDSAGNPHKIADWFGAWSARKVIEFCRATGMHSVLEKQELKASDLIINTGGRCVIAVRQANGQYPASNEIKSYLPSQSSRTQQSALSDSTVKPIRFEFNYDPAEVN